MDTSFDKAHFNMIEQQIRPWDVSDDRVLETMSEVRRERFVPKAYRGLAFADIEIPIGDGRSMPAPKIVGRMLQALAVGSDDCVLEIGAGNGYATACLVRLAGRVISLETDPVLVEQARGIIGTGKPRRLMIRQGDGLAAPVDGGPFDAIAVNGSLPDDSALAGLQQQLTPGGRLFAVIGEDPVMRATLVTRTAAGEFDRTALFETSVPSLAEVPESESERFVF